MNPVNALKVFVIVVLVVYTNYMILGQQHNYMHKTTDSTFTVQSDSLNFNLLPNDTLIIKD